MKKIVIIGAGGFAREVEWLIREINKIETQYQFIGYVVSDLSKVGPNDSVNQILGDYDWLNQNRESWDCLALGVGSPNARLKVAAEITKLFPNAKWPALIHPSVHYDKASCEICEGTLICAGTIGTVNLKIGPFALINLSCTLGHEAVIGRGCVLNPTVNISGGVKLGEGVLIGTGAQVLQYIDIGDNAIVGAGAVATKSVPKNTTVVGVPAKPIKHS